MVRPGSILLLFLVFASSSGFAGNAWWESCWNAIQTFHLERSFKKGKLPSSTEVRFLESFDEIDLEILKRSSRNGLSEVIAVEYLDQNGKTLWVDYVDGAVPRPGVVSTAETGKALGLLQDQKQRMRETGKWVLVKGVRLRHNHPTDLFKSAFGELFGKPKTEFSKEDRQAALHVKAFTEIMSEEGLDVEFQVFQSFELLTPIESCPELKCAYRGKKESFVIPGHLKWGVDYSPGRVINERWGPRRPQ